MPNLSTLVNQTTFPAQSGSAPFFGVRAWVNFKGDVTNNINDCNFTFNQGTTFVTITTPVDKPHGLVPGNALVVSNPRGPGGGGFSPPDVGSLMGLFRVATVTSPNTFTYNTNAAADSTRTGTIDLRRRRILASGNVNSVTPSTDAADVGSYIINFQTPMNDSNYIHLAPAVGQATTSYNWGVRALSATESFLQVQVNNSNTGANISEPPYVAIAIIR